MVANGTRRGHAAGIDRRGTCRTADHLDRVAQLLWEHDIGGVPVVDQQGHVAGMLTDRDICMAAYLRGLPLSAIPVSAAMATEVVSCGPDDELSAVEQTMSRRQNRRMPVIDGDGHAIAVISLDDIDRRDRRAGSPTSCRTARSVRTGCVRAARGLARRLQREAACAGSAPSAPSPSRTPPSSVARTRRSAS